MADDLPTPHQIIPYNPLATKCGQGNKVFPIAPSSSTLAKKRTLRSDKEVGEGSWRSSPVQIPKKAARLLAETRNRLLFLDKRDAHLGRGENNKLQK